MEDVEIGDIVGWRFSLFNDESENGYGQGEVVSLYGNYLCLRNLNVTVPHLNPFHALPRGMCYMIKKKAA